MKALNPYSVKLEKAPFMELSNQIYKDGDFSIFKYSNEHYVHTFKNIVFAERTKANKELINNIKNDIKPTDESDYYHQYLRPKEAIEQGIKHAKKIKFNIQ